MNRLKQYICTLLFYAAAMCAHAQSDWNAAGVWTGKMYNDSTKKFIPFEIALSYQNGQYSGYTYTVFMIDSIENIGVKNVTVKEKNGRWIIRDKKLIDDNYKEAPAKGVYTTLELEHLENDTADILSGRWFTNKTKEFYPLTGTVTVARRKNIFATRIIPKLQELGLAEGLSFFNYSSNLETVVTNEKNKDTREKESKDSMITIVEPELVISIPKNKTSDLKIPGIDILKDVIDSTASENKTIKETNEIKKPAVLGNKEEHVNTKLSEKNTMAAEQEQRNHSKEATTEIVSLETVVQQHSIPGKQQQTKTNAQQRGNPERTPMIISEKKPIKSDPPKDRTTPTANRPADSTLTTTTAVSAQKPFTPVPSAPKVDLSDRQIETIRTVSVSGDSLVLSLFDNGAVDGDTVSVLLNGKVIVSKVGLLEKAFNHTVHLTPDMGDSINVVLYAENLGSIPPNTGLLVVRNAGHDYEIRFSGDLTKNSAIILLRNRKE